MNSLYTELLLEQGINEHDLRTDGYNFGRGTDPDLDDPGRPNYSTERRKSLQGDIETCIICDIHDGDYMVDSADACIHLHDQSNQESRPVNFYIPRRDELYYLGYGPSKPLFYPYKRMTHFKMYLSALQNTRTLYFSDLGIFKDIVLDYRNLYFTVRKALQQNRLSKYYPDIFLIIAHLGGKTLKLTNEQYHLILKRFSQLEYIFQHQSHPHRKYFLHYYTVIDTLLEYLKIPYHYKLPTIRNTDRCEYVQKTLYQYINKLLP
jgi:hypothetical protein